MSARTRSDLICVRKAKYKPTIVDFYDSIARSRLWEQWEITLSIGIFINIMIKRRRLISKEIIATWESAGAMCNIDFIFHSHGDSTSIDTIAASCDLQRKRCYRSLISAVRGMFYLVLSHARHCSSNVMLFFINFSFSAKNWINGTS